VASLENVSSVVTDPVAQSQVATPEAKVETVASAATPTSVPATDGGTSLTNKLPHQLAAKSGSQGASGPPVTQAEQMRLVQRVARAVQAAQARGGEIQIRLSPPSLGSLKLEVKVQNGVMTARIEAENATSRTILLENLPVLKERLADQGIQVESFDVDLMDRQPQGEPDTSHGRERQLDPRLPRGASHRRVDEAAHNTPTKSPTSEAPLRPGEGKINVTI
jgi:flagellar hook-length control protein FliK